MPAAAVVPPDRHVRGEAGQLPLPVAEQRRRTHHQRRPRLQRPPVQVQRDHLHGLAQPHVVGQAAAQPQLTHFRQPGQASALIGSQGGPQALGRLDGGSPRPGQPVDEVGKGAGGVELDHFAVQHQVAGERGGQRLGSGDPWASPAPQPLEQLAVHPHPAATQPHQRALRLGQRGDLLGRQRLAAHRHLPVEAEQRLQPENGRRGAGRCRGRHGGTHVQPFAEQLGRPQDLDAGTAERLGTGLQQLGHLLLVEADLGRGRRAQQRRQRRPCPSAAAQGQQQIGLGALAQPRQHRRRGAPQLSGVHHQAGVGRAAHLDHRGERLLLFGRQLDPELHLRPGVQAPVGLRQPADKLPDRDRLGRGKGTRPGRVDRRRGPHQGVGDRVPQRTDQPLRRAQPQRAPPIDGQGVALRRHRGGDPPQPVQVGGIQRPDPPRTVPVGSWRQAAGAPAPPARHRPPPRPTRPPPTRWRRRRPVPAAPAGPTRAAAAARGPAAAAFPCPPAAPGRTRPSPAHHPTRPVRRHAADRPGRRWRTAQTPDARSHSTQRRPGQLDPQA